MTKILHDFGAESNLCRDESPYKTIMRVRENLLCNTSFDIMVKIELVKISVVTK